MDFVMVKIAVAKIISLVDDVAVVVASLGPLRPG